MAVDESVTSAEEAATFLYGLDPDQFVATRNQLAATLKQAGRTQDANAVKSLHKPTITGWALNTLVREDRVQVDQLLAIGDELRRAQRDLSGDSLRTLTGQRHRLVRAVAGRVGELAEAAGHPLSPAVLEQVSRSLDAAMTDQATGAHLVQGRVVGELSYAGLGESGAEAPGLHLVDTATSPAPDPGPGRRRALKLAEKALKEAATEREDAQERLARAEDAKSAAHLRAAAAQETLAAAAAELEAAEKAEETASRAASLAEKTFNRATHREEAAAEHLASLRK
jgi:hypothetical protein